MSGPMIFRHYKGGTYEFVTNGRLEADGKTSMVAYRALDGDMRGAVWMRPWDEFFGEVDGQRRFAPVDICKAPVEPKF